MKRRYEINGHVICEIPNPNKQRSQTKVYWTINELKNNKPYFSVNYSDHSQSFHRTRNWLLQNHPELLL